MTDEMDLSENDGQSEAERNNDVDMAGFNEEDLLSGDSDDGVFLGNDGTKNSASEEQTLTGNGKITSPSSWNPLLRQRLFGHIKT